MQNQNQNQRAKPQFVLEPLPLTPSDGIEEKNLLHEKLEWKKLRQIGKGYLFLSFFTNKLVLNFFCKKELLEVFGYQFKKKKQTHFPQKNKIN